MKRKINFDLMRVFLAFLVVVLHTSAFFWPLENFSDNNFLYLSFINSFTRASVPVFLMLSGYFLLSREENLTYILKKSLHIYILFIIWSIFYTFPAILRDFSFKNFINLFLSSNYHLWYLMAAVWCYLLSPFLYGLKKLPEKYFNYMMVFMILFGPISYSLSNFINILNHPTLYNLYSTLKIYFFGNIIIYFALGYFLKKDFNKIFDFILKNNLILFLIFVCVSIFNGFLTFHFSKVENSPTMIFFDNFNIIVFLQSFIIFLFFKNINFSSIKKSTEKIILIFSKCSFGIYLIHPFILRYLGPLFLEKNPISSTFILSFIIFILSFVFSFIVLKMPFAKKLVS